MPPTIASFADLFHVATNQTADDPFPYQITFATDPHKFAEVVHAPTGAGKTATAVLGWLYRRRFHPDLAIRKTTPRRLVYCLPMRVLVEQTFAEAVRWLHRLGLLDAPPDFTPEEPAGVKAYQPLLGPESTDKIAVHLLMGGEPRRDWDLFPERDAILIGTQDMLLSRALNRGYGIGRFRWPMHYGLLNTDSLWVFDEVQLMSTGLATSTQLEAFREIQLGGCGAEKASRSVWMSATLLRCWLESPDFRNRVPQLTTLGLTQSDFDAPGLKERWLAEKPVQRAAVAADDSRAMCEFVARVHVAGSLTLVIVNTVDRSRQLLQGVRHLFGLEKKPKGWGKQPNPAIDTSHGVPDLKLIHSRFRPVERAEWLGWLTENPSKLPPGGRIVISTQVVEAGVDLSARTLITELAPWPSLVQRFGRCNRRGEFGPTKGNPAQVFWLDLPTATDGAKGEKKPKSLALPYTDNELNAARLHLANLPDAGLQSLQRFFDALPPAEREELFPYAPAHVVRRKDAVELFDTTPDLAGNDIDVSRFIRDGDELDVQVFWRVAEPQPGWSKAELRRQAPRREELCPVPFVRFREDFLGKGKVAFRFDSLGQDKLGKRKGVWVKASKDNVFPGQVYWVSAGQGGYDPLLGWSPGSPTVVEEVPRPPETDLPENPESGYDADEWSEGAWQTVAEHTDRVVDELEAVARNLTLTDNERAVLRVAARWHDWGKTHDTFQRAIRRPVEFAGRLLAKAPDGRWADYDRTHFRHELASALAVLALLARPDAVPPEWKKLASGDGLTDLAMYLIAAHHGKVRLSIRSLPGEKRPVEAGKLFARGVWDGDPLPEVDLGGRVTAPAVVLNLAPMQLGADADGRPSWAERMLGVRDRVGPFRTAYLEAILRAADMRASRVPATRTGEADHV